MLWIAWVQRFGAAGNASGRAAGATPSLMSHLPDVLGQLLMIFGGAAIAALIFKILRLPVVLGYMLAGLLIGPHVLPRMVADIRLVGTLSDLGVILLFFTIGLEFSIRTIARVGLATLVTVLIELSLTAAAVYGVGCAFGWTTTEALFAALGVIIASTMLVVKGLDEHEVKGPAAQLILAIMVVEDLLSVLLLAIVTGIASGTGMVARELAVLIAQMAAFLATMIAIGILVVPRTIRLVVRLGRGDLLLITSLAICFAMVWVAARAGYSIALGAFLAGTLIAESGKASDVDALVRPFRDVFAAIFFVSIGMLIDPALIAAHWLPAVVIAAVLVVGKTASISMAGFLTGSPLRRSVAAGLSLSQIGEISFIIAAIGVRAGVARPFLLPVVVGASCITALTGSWQIRGASRVASWLDANLPRPIAMFVTFYESWLARLQSSHRHSPDTLWRRLRLSVVALSLDAGMLAAVTIGASIARPRVAPWAVAPIVVAAVVVGALFALGLVRQSFRLARILAAEMIPTTSDGALATAPRNALQVTLVLAIALVVGVPLAVAIQTFVPFGALIVVAALAVLVLATRRSIANFHSHVRAGSELIVEILGRQGIDPNAPPPTLHEVEAALPGFGGLTAVAVPEGATAVGQSLADLDLRARTGASVLAVTRGGQGAANPSPREPLQAGDVLALAGSGDAIAAARELLTTGLTPP
jgi:CPA2 family monovalent cation:H+ antiporter-2